jgi:lipoprotein-anchoring transpeptidase ErfK/SrfK
MIRFGKVLSKAALLVTTPRIVALSAVVVMSSIASASSPIYIWKSQRMGYHDGYYFPVSIGHKGNPTPTGKFTVKKKDADYVSFKYKLPMPYAVFFTDAHAIHSGDISTASRGCVRVPREWAVWLYSKAQSGKTKVVVRP